MTKKTVVITQEFADALGAPAWWIRIIARMGKQKFVFIKKRNQWVLKSLVTGHIKGNHFFPDDQHYKPMMLWYLGIKPSPIAEVVPASVPVAYPIVAEMLKTQPAHVKIMLWNRGESRLTVELFNKRNGIKMKTLKGTGFISLSCEVITDKATQSYEDFFESILNTGIVISNLKPTNDVQFICYMKDLLHGKRHITPDIYACYHALFGRTVMQVELLPDQKFEIDFDIQAIQRVEFPFDNPDQYSKY